MKSLVIADYADRTTEYNDSLGGSSIDDNIEYLMKQVVDEYHDDTYSKILKNVDDVRRIHPSLDIGGRFSKIPLLLMDEIERIQYLAYFTSEIVMINAQLAQYAIKMINAISERREQLENLIILVPGKRSIRILRLLGR